MSLILTPLFTEDFTSAALQDPLAPTTWSADTSSFGGPSDTFAVVDNTPPPGVSGKCCQTSAGAVDIEGFAYWSGDAPAAGFVKATLSNLESSSGLTFMYGVVTPKQLFTSGGFYMQVNGPFGAGAGQIRLIYEPGDPAPFVDLITLNGITLSEGDVVTIAYVGISHYGFLNGVQIFDVDYAPAPTVGGVFSAGIASQVNLFTDVQVLNVTIGSAAESTSVWSPVDSRVAKPNSATFRTVNAAQIDDVQTSSNAAVPGTDSRPNIPVASATYPQNSRNAPPF